MTLRNWSRGGVRKRLMGQDMSLKVTMKQPIAFPLRHPANRHRRAGRHSLCYNRLARRRLIVRGGAFLPVEGVYPIIETMEMHRVNLRRCVDHAPTESITHGCRQPL